MLPYITIGDVKLPIFSFGLSVSAIIFLFLCIKSAKEKGLEEEIGGEIAVIILFVIVFFSKIPLGIIYGWKIQNLFKFWETGHTLFGGMILGVLATLFYSAIKKISFMEILSVLSYPSLFALASYRIFVCLLTGCCYGFPSQKYGITFHPESYAGRTIGGTPKLFPSQIVEAALFLISGSIIYAIRKKIKSEKIIQIYLLLISIQRIIAELIRRDIKENFFKVEDFSISIWAILSIALFTATSLFFNVFKPYLEELKKTAKYFLIMSLLSVLTAVNITSCSQNQKAKNSSHAQDTIETLRTSFTFTYSTIFISYIFFKIQGFLGYCVFKDGQSQKIKINCSFDLRLVSASRGQTKGECDFSSDKGKAIFKNCKIEIKSENPTESSWIKITGNVETEELNSSLESIKLQTLNPVSSFEIYVDQAQSNIFQIQGGSIRFFEIKGQGRIEENKIHVDKIFAKDEGGGKVGIMPQGIIEISGCKNFQLNIFSKEYVFFDDSGCPISGDVKIGEEELIFPDPRYCTQEQKSCPFILF